MYAFPAFLRSRLGTYFLFSFLVCSALFSHPQSVLADSVPSGFPVELPYALPYDDGTTVFTKYLLIAPTFGTSGQWYLYYHNNGSGDIFLNSSYQQIWTDSARHLFYAGASATAGSWTDGGDDDDGSNYAFISSDSFFGGDTTCKDNIFSSHTIFAAGSYSGAAYCADIVPYSPGDVIFGRVNLEDDYQTFQTTISDPGPAIIINSQATGDYVDVPNPLTDPTGFVSAVFTNFFIAIYKAVIPPDNYFYDKVSSIGTTWTTEQPGLASINTAFSDGIVSLASPTSLSPVTIGSLHIGSADTSTITVFDPASFDPSIFDGAKTLISAFMYFGVAFWVLREVSTIMSA